MIVIFLSKNDKQNNPRIIYLLFWITGKFKNLDNKTFSIIKPSEKKIFTSGKTIARLNSSNIIVMK
jgi:hypothetical protein